MHSAAASAPTSRETAAEMSDAPHRRIRPEPKRTDMPAERARARPVAASRTTTESRSCRGACILLRTRFRMAAWRSGCRLPVGRLPARRPWLAGPSPMRSPRQSRWLPGCGRCPAALLVRHRPEPFREDDLQALLRLLRYMNGPLIPALPRPPPWPPWPPFLGGRRNRQRGKDRSNAAFGSRPRAAHNHRIRSSAVTRTPLGARWRTAPAPPRRRSDRPARLRGSTSAWDRCARPSCAEPGTARRGTWCSRLAP